MTSFTLDQTTIGKRVVVVELIGQSDGSEETRWTHFERRELAEGETLFTPKYLPVNRLRTVQGHVGEKPRYDSGEYCVASQMPARTLVMDEINHEWTEAHAGLMIVAKDGSGVGVYVNSKLVYVLGRSELNLAETLARAIDPDIAVAYGSVEEDMEYGFPADLMKLRLKDILSC